MILIKSAKFCVHFGLFFISVLGTEKTYLISMDTLHSKGKVMGYQHNSSFKKY